MATAISTRLPRAARRCGSWRGTRPWWRNTPAPMLSALAHPPQPIDCAAVAVVAQKRPFHAAQPAVQAVDAIALSRQRRVPRPQHVAFWLESAIPAVRGRRRTLPVLHCFAGYRLTVTIWDNRLQLLMEGAEMQCHRDGCRRMRICSTLSAYSGVRVHSPDTWGRETARETRLRASIHPTRTRSHPDGRSRDR